MNFINAERLLHSIKTAIACCAAYLLVRLTGQASNQWIIISVIVVMCSQIYVGGMLQKSYLRLLGTLLGCLMASAAIYFFKDSHFVTLITITLAGFIFSYVATTKESFNQMGTLGAVTTVIILLSNDPTLYLAVARFLEISIGILIAALVSQFIFPIHARTHLRRAQAASLAQIKEFYTRAVTKRYEIESASNELDESIIKSLMVQRQLAKDSAKELIGKRFDPNHFARTLYCEREILRSIDFMDMALSKLEGHGVKYPLTPVLATFHEAVHQSFDVLIRTLRSNNLTGAHIHLPDNRSLATHLRQDNFASAPQQQIYLDGFAFAAEILVNNLGELGRLYDIPVTGAPLPT